MWVTKLLISPVKKGLFAQKRPNLAQNWHFWSIWARPCRLIQCPVGGCGARAVSRKTPIYFMYLIFWSVGGGKLFAFYHFRCLNSRLEDDMSQFTGKFLKNKHNYNILTLFCQLYLRYKFGELIITTVPMKRTLGKLSLLLSTSLRR